MLVTGFGRKVAAMTTAACIVLSTSVAAKAGEAASPSGDDVAEALGNVAGLFRGTVALRPQADGSPAPVSAADTNVTPPEDSADQLDIRSAGDPVLTLGLPAAGQASKISYSTEGLALYPALGPSVSGAVQLLDDGAVRVMVVIHDPEALERFSFPLEVPADVKVVDSGGGGAYLFRDGDPLPVGAIESPWGRDAEGKPVPVSQVVTTDSVDLLVSHRSVDELVYPLVVDPSYSTIPCSTYTRDGTEVQYQRSNICPVAVFFNNRGYWPVRSHQPEYPWRNVRQSGECSWMPDTGPYWDFQTACKAHDYCYDLRRETYPAVYPYIDKSTCDSLLDEDLGIHCNSRASLYKSLCNSLRSDMMLFVRTVGTDPRP